eukprot:Pgem_evm1s16386
MAFAQVCLSGIDLFFNKVSCLKRDFPILPMHDNTDILSDRMNYNPLPSERFYADQKTSNPLLSVESALCWLEMNYDCNNELLNSFPDIKKLNISDNAKDFENIETLKELHFVCVFNYICTFENFDMSKCEMTSCTGIQKLLDLGDFNNLSTSIIRLSKILSSRLHSHTEIKACNENVINGNCGEKINKPSSNILNEVTGDLDKSKLNTVEDSMHIILQRLTYCKQIIIDIEESHDTDNAQLLELVENQINNMDKSISDVKSVLSDFYQQVQVCINSVQPNDNIPCSASHEALFDHSLKSNSKISKEVALDTSIIYEGTGNCALEIINSSCNDFGDQVYPTFMLQELKSVIASRSIDNNIDEEKSNSSKMVQINPHNQPESQRSLTCQPFVAKVVKDSQSLNISHAYSSKKTNQTKQSIVDLHLEIENQLKGWFTRNDDIICEQ